jgi:UDP-glucose-4-epimerase GalE
LAKILIVGGAGYIGSHTTYSLLRRGHDCIVADSLVTGYRHNVAAERLQVVSLHDKDAVRQLLEAGRFDAVIHFAASIAVGESTQVPQRYFTNNVSGSFSLLEAMIETGVKKIVFSSTAAVYGTPAKSPITEDMPYHPESPYGETKVMVEKALQWHDQCVVLRSVCLRYFNACGAEPKAGLGEEHIPETHLIPLVLRAATGVGKPVTVFGTDYPTRDGSCERDYIHVMDLAEAHALALDHLLDGGATRQFNCGTGNGYTVLEVIRAVEKAVGKPVPHSIGPRRAGDPATLVADSTRLRTELGWKPVRSDLDAIVRDALEFEPIRLARASQ